MSQPSGELIPGASALAQKGKSFFARPEGKAGILFGIPLLGALGWGLFNALPYIIVLLQNTITAIVLAAVTFGIGYILLDNNFHTLVWYVYKMTMKKLTGILIELDPVAIVESYLDDLREHKAHMSTQISNLRGQMAALSQEIERNKEARERALKTVKAAHGAGKQKALVLQARKAGRLRQSNLTLENLRQKLEMLYRVLNKMDEAADFMLQDMADEINVKKRERAAIHAASGAFHSALSIIRGNPSKRLMFERAMEHMADDFAMRVGEIEDFLVRSEGFMESIDLTSMTYEEEALQEIEEWEKKADSLVLGPGDKQLLIESSISDWDRLDISRALPAGRRDEEAIPAALRGKRPAGTPPHYDDLFPKDESPS